MKMVDLHIHTNLSDGLLSPEKVVQKALDNNCHIISITDHDIINDYSYLEDMHDITILSGIEFNTAVSNLHLLGYNIKDISTVNKEMLTLKIANENICHKVISLMQQDGYDISQEQIFEYIHSINLEYDIIDKRKIVKYLIYKGYVDSTIEAYQKLIGKDTKYYIPNYKISPKETINLIRNTGGIPILAHPGTIKLSASDLYGEVKALVDAGLMGIEVYNEKMNSGDIIYNVIANSYGLIKTVGSDFHNPKTDNIGININDNMYEEISKQLIRKK